MSDQIDKTTITQYASFMEEIKTRLDAVHPIVRTLGKDGGTPTDFLQAEFCLLQVRFVCELIALASLVAHHPLGVPKDLLKLWNAERIFRDLEEVNEHCFPKHATINRSDNGVHVKVTRDIMDRADLQKIYSQCGEMLHRGMIKHVISGKDRIYDLQKIDVWMSQIGRLLSTHAIMMLDTGVVLIVNMTGGANNSVHVALAKGGPAILEQPAE